MRVMIPIDVLPNTDEVLRFSDQNLRQVEEPPTLLCITNDRTGRVRSSANSSLRNIQSLHIPLHHQAKIRIDQLIKQTIQKAREGNYDMIIVGDTGRFGFKSFFSKKIAYRVAENAPCSVLIVKGKARPIHRILLCDSGGGRTTGLGHYVAQLTDLIPLDVEIIVLHVMSQISAGPGVSGKQLRIEAPELIETHTPEGNLLERDIQALKRLGLNPLPKVRHGLVLDEILSEAHTGDYDLVIIGAHDSSRWQRLLLDDLANKVMTQLNCSVLIVKGKQ